MAQEIASLYAKIGADSSQFDRAMGGVEGRLHSVGGLIKGAFAVGVGVAVAGVTALGATIAKSTQAAADMEQQVANITAVWQLNGEEVKKVDELIMNLGLNPNLKVTAVEAGQAIEILAKNGLTLQQVMGGAAESVVLLQNATGTDFSTAADIGTQAMSLFGIKAEDLGKAVNQMVGFTNASKFGIEDYKYVLADAAPVLSKLGVSFEDFNAIMAVTSANFASGMTQGTAFKTMFTRLIPQTDKAIGVMTDLGLIVNGQNQFFNADGTIKSMMDIVGTLKKAVGGMSQMDQVDVLTQIFGTEGSQAVLAMLNVTQDQLAATYKTIGDTSAVDQAKTRMDTFNGQWEILQGIIETTSIAIGKKFLPVGGKVIAWAQRMASKYGPALVDWFGKLADRVGGVWDAFEAGKFNYIGDAVGQIFDAFRRGVDFFNTWKGVFAGALQEVWAWLTGGPTGGFGNLKQVWSLATWAVTAALGNIKKFADDNLPRWIESLQSWGTAAWNWLVEVTPKLVTTLAEWGGKLLGWVTDNLPSWINTLKGWGAAAWQWIVDATPTVLGKLGELWNSLASWITDPGKRNQLLTNLNNGWNAFSGWAGGLWNEQILPKLTELWGNLTAWITDPARPGEALTAITNAWDWFTGWAGKIYELVAPKLGAFWTGLTSWVTDPAKRAVLIQNLTERWNAFSEWAGGLWTSVSTNPQFIAMPGRINAWIAMNVPQLQPWIDGFAQFGAGMKEQWNKDYPELLGIFETFVAGMETKLARLKAAFANIFGENGQGGQIQGWGENFVKVFSWIERYSFGIIDSMAEGFVGLAETIGLVKQAFDAATAGDWGKFGNLMLEATKTLGNAALKTAAPQFTVTGEALTEFNKWLSTQGRASGGPVSAGNAYLVGEKGPEMFVPGSSGSIVPNGAGGRIDLYVHGDLPSSRAALRELAIALKREFDLTGAVMVN